MPRSRRRLHCFSTVLTRPRLLNSNGEHNLLGDGVIYPAQTANTGHTTILGDGGCKGYECDHSADYIGTGR